MSTPDHTQGLTVITGASNGIGAELARIFARYGHRLFLTGRDQQRLEALADEIAQSRRERPLILALDLNEPNAAQDILQALQQTGESCAILVNNAGYGQAGRMHQALMPDQIGMIDLNIRALTELTLGFLPQIIANQGGILNVASTAAFFSGPSMAVYYASKAYVRSLSDALHYELASHQVSVTTLCPGPTQTGFAQRAGIDGPLFKLMRPMAASQVAEAGYQGLMRRKRLVIPGLSNKAAVLLSHVIPRHWSMPIIAWLQDKRQN
jgi:short-subunit dehydrogenase